MQALLEQARLPTWRIWAKDAAIEKKDVLKARGYAWSPGEFGRPKCWYRDVSDADKAAEAAWLRANVMGVGSSHMGVAHHGEESLFGSMLGLGGTGSRAGCSGFRHRVHSPVSIQGYTTDISGS
jgi:hypothetical protein